MFSAFDEQMMRRALELAQLGRYTAHPNPRVGCLVVQNERIVGEGWHRKWGEPHAEPLALAAAGELARNATVYVSLEPHSYQGRTPPCTTALIKAGVKRVVCGTLDPNPKVSGAGIAQLKDAGIQTEAGLLEAEARALNLGFEKRMRTGLPRLIVKVAASLDGRIALANGASRWITGAQARADVHRLRAECSAVLTGIDTVIADDPQLTVRDDSIDLAGRAPLRVVLDTHLRMLPSARMLAEVGSILIFTGESNASGAKAEALRAAGAQVRPLRLDNEGRIDMHDVLRELGGELCNDVLVEAGPTLSGHLIERRFADELIVYLAPKLLGDDAKAMVKLPALSSLDAAPQLVLIDTQRVGEDLKLVYRPKA